MARSQRPPLPATTRLAAAVISGAVVVIAVASTTTPAMAALSGIATTEAVFVVWGWMVLWPLDAERTRANVQREDFRPAIDEALVVGVALAGLFSIAALVLLKGSNVGRAALALGAVGMAWAAMHLMYASRYAGLYYRRTDHDGNAAGGIDFNSDEEPSYRDFLYFSYNLGMTYQVSDTAVSATAVRQVVLRHCLLSYLFGTGILATTINLVVAVVSR